MRVAISAAGIGLILLMALVAAGAVVIKRAAIEGEGAVKIDVAYQHAATAVAAEESLERKYRLQPGPTPKAAHAVAEASLEKSMEQVKSLGNASDHKRALTVLRENNVYVKSTALLFMAVDHHDPVSVINAIDSGSVDPVFGAIETRVYAAAAIHQRDALNATSAMRRTGGVVFLLDLGALLATVGLVIVTALTIRRYQKRLMHDYEVNRHQVSHDSLTNLPNRILFNDRCGVALRASHHRSGAVVVALILDLDRFKDVNDTLGHQYGDELLLQVADRLCATLREADMVARLGGDEFAILLPTSGWDDAIEVAERIGTSLTSPFIVHEVALDVEASIGIAAAEAGDDVDTLVRHADVAMYKAKGDHRPFARYESSLDVNSRARLALLGDLRRAIAARELILHYQPKVDAASGDVTGVEALVRWQHPTRGLILPDEFIPIAENTALIHSLTSEVLRIALLQAREWADGGDPIPIAVNISAHSLLDKGFPNVIAHLLDAYAVPSSLLTLELTESAIMKDPSSAVSILRSIAALGVELSVDDFGTGYSSMSYLKTLPVQEIKVDRSFVMAMTTDADSAIIVRSTIELGHNLGLRVVAEGVENLAIRSVLEQFGCDTLQGYGICRPVPIEELNKWLAVRKCPHDILL